MDAPDVWVAADDGRAIARAAAIAWVDIDDQGSVTAGLGHAGGDPVTLVHPGSEPATHPVGDFHRQLIRVIAQLSDASGAFLVRPAHDEVRGWQWLTEPL
jgi:hypothetical protein